MLYGSLDGREVWGRMDTRICMAESLRCSPETITTLLIGHTPKQNKNLKLPLLLLSRFSRVRLCTTPWTAAHEAPPSMGFSRQECWSGVPLPYREIKVNRKKKKEHIRLFKVIWLLLLSPLSCPTLCDPIDPGPPGSSVHGILQARIVE